MTHRLYGSQTVDQCSGGSLVRKVSEKLEKITYARQPRYSRWVTYEHVKHHRYPGTLTNSSVHHKTNQDEILPGGSILHTMRSLRSSLSVQTDPPSLFGGTTHESPSDGKQSSMAFPNGRYGTSNSSRRLSCSASLLSAFPSVRTK